MKHKLLVLALLANGALFAQALPNGGFESWTATTWLDPQYFGTSNDLGNHGGSIGTSNIPPANVTQTAGKYGNYGIQVATIKYNGDTIGGYFVDANTGGNGNGLTGGIPYNQKPTGMRFWYKYTTTGVDTAAVLVIFKKSGTPIDSFLVAIPSSASTSTYTLRSYHPKNPLPLTPDTVIFGAVSSKGLISSNHKNNKGILPGSTLTIDSVTFTGVGASQPAELNGNFENWVTDTVNTPTGWYINYPGVTRTTDHYAGSYALQLATINSPNSGISTGQAGTGYYPNNCNSNCNEQGGFAFTNQVDTLTFWYKYLPKPNDTASVWMSFIKKGVGIYGQGINISTTASTWTLASIPFNIGQAPDTVVVNMQASTHNDTSSAQYAPYVGTVFKVDNMMFKSQPLAVMNIQQPGAGMKVYPNPAKQTLNIDLNTANEPTGATVLIMDILGNEAMQAKPDFSKGTVSINISGLASGIYFVKVMTDNSATVAKFIKQ